METSLERVILRTRLFIRPFMSLIRLLLNVMRKAREEGRCVCHITDICLAELCQDLPLLPPRKTNIHEDQNREHQQRQNGPPLEQESEQDQDKRSVLRMANLRVGTRCRQRVVALRLIEDLPGGGEENKPAEDQKITEQVERSEMGVSAPAEEDLQQVS